MHLAELGDVLRVGAEELEHAPEVALVVGPELLEDEHEDLLTREHVVEPL